MNFIKLLCLHSFIATKVKENKIQSVSVFIIQPKSKFNKQNSEKRIKATLVSAFVNKKRSIQKYNITSQKIHVRKGKQLH